MTIILIFFIVTTIILGGFVYLLDRKNEKDKEDYQNNINGLIRLMDEKDKTITEMHKATELFRLQKTENDEAVGQLRKELVIVKTDFYSLKDDYDKLLNQKKSSEVKLGKTAENHAPFFTEWPYDARKFRFIGDPVDGVQFNDDSIIFVEIKTGKSRLSPSQRNIKALISAGQVKFGEFRIDDTNCEFKLDE